MSDRTYLWQGAGRTFRRAGEACGAARFLAENLEAHVPTIDLDDPNGRTERLAYEPLAAESTLKACNFVPGEPFRFSGCTGSMLSPDRLRFAPHRPKLPGNPGSPRPRTPDRQIH